jgi:hypothetical protein
MLSTHIAVIMASSQDALAPMKTSWLPARQFNLGGFSVWWGFHELWIAAQGR